MLRDKRAFTIVELVVVIVVIAILASVTALTYVGVRDRALNASLKSDLYSAYNRLKQYQAENDVYPLAVDDCPTPSASNICVETSDDNSYFDEYEVDNTADTPTFSLKIKSSIIGTVFIVTQDTVPFELTAEPEPEPEKYGWVQISAGYDHTCGVLSDGRAFCWGSNTYGQLGTGNNTSSTSPVQVKTTGALRDKTIVQIAAGTQFTIALDSDGVVYTWGIYSYGQLGNGSACTSCLGSSSPGSIASAGVLAGKTIKSISAGDMHGLTIDANGLAHSWGYNAYCGLGYGACSSSSSNVDFKKTIPVDVLSTGALNGKTLSMIYGGKRYSAALSNENKIYTWGLNTYGQLGIGNTYNQSSPIAVSTSGVLSGKVIEKVSAGDSAILALDSNGVVYSWGRNNAGQLGINSTTNATSPALVVSNGVLNSKVIVDIAEGKEHSLALDSNGIVYSWGNYGYGELGDNGVYSANRLVPGLVYASGALNNKVIEKIFAGSYNSFAIDSDRQAYAWGKNDYGQLGIGSSTDSTKAVQITLPAEL